MPLNNKNQNQSSAKMVGSLHFKILWQIYFNPYKSGQLN